MLVQLTSTAIMIFPFPMGVLFNPISILDTYYCNFKPFESSKENKSKREGYKTTTHTWF